MQYSLRLCWKNHVSLWWKNWVRLGCKCWLQCWKNWVRLCCEGRVWLCLKYSRVRL